MASELNIWQQVKYSFYATLVFLILTNPLTYAFTQLLAKGLFAVTHNSVPTAEGYILHAILFFCVMLALMQWAKA